MDAPSARTMTRSLVSLKLADLVVDDAEMSSCNSASDDSSQRMTRQDRPRPTHQRQRSLSPDWSLHTPRTSFPMPDGRGRRFPSSSTSRKLWKSVQYGTSSCKVLFLGWFCSWCQGLDWMALSHLKLRHFVESHAQNLLPSPCLSSVEVAKIPQCFVVGFCLGYRCRSNPGHGSCLRMTECRTLSGGDGPSQDRLRYCHSQSPGSSGTDM